MSRRWLYAALGLGVIGYAWWWFMTKKPMVDGLKEAAKRQRLDWRLLVAIAWRESSLNPKALNIEDPLRADDDSVGLMQVSLRTAKWLEGRDVTKQELFVPGYNSELGARYLRYQFDRYNGSMRKAVAAYNAGSYRERRPGVAVNNAYVGSVLNLYEALCDLL